MILVFLYILYIHVVCVDCFSGAWRVFICSRWNGLSSCWILGRSSQYWSLYIILIIILSWLLHSALWLFWYCSRALLSTDQRVADSSTNARVQVCYHCHCELGFNWINPGSRRRQRFFSSFIISFNLIAYFVTFVWITNYHHRHHHIHHHLTGLVVPLLLTRVAFMWAEASARTRSIFH